MPPSLPPKSFSRRQGLLRDYLIACVQDNVLTWRDLTSPDLLETLKKTLVADVKEVGEVLGRRGLAGMILFGASVAVDWAQKLRERKP